MSTISSPVGTTGKRTMTGLTGCFIAGLYTSLTLGISFANHYPSGIILRMTTMIAELYDALKEAGASEEKAIAAAKSIADYENHFVRMESKFDSLESKLESEVGSLGSKISSLESRLGSKIGSLESKLESEIGSLESRLGSKINSLESKLESRLGTKVNSLESKINSLDSEIKIVKAELSLIKWLLGFGIAGTISLIIKAFI